MCCDGLAYPLAFLLMVLNCRFVYRQRLSFCLMNAPWDTQQFVNLGQDLLMWRDVVIGRLLHLNTR